MEKVLIQETIKANESVSVLEVTFEELQKQMEEIKAAHPNHFDFQFHVDTYNYNVVSVRAYTYKTKEEAY